MKNSHHHLHISHILIADDEPAIRRAFKSVLEMESFIIEEAIDGAQCLEKVKQKKYDVIFLDVRMPKKSGIECLDEILSIYPDLPVIIISGERDIKTAVACIQKGAFDYMEKPFDLNHLNKVLRDALNSSMLVAQKSPRRKLPPIASTYDIIGNSRLLTALKEKIETIAPYQSEDVLITGANGSGKELVARQIHEKSGRKNAPFVEVNCAAIPASLIESTLFGSTKWSFTDAKEDKKGKFEEANGGSLFLDEVGDMSLSAQAAILRVLETRKVSPIGSTKMIDVNIRVISATNKNLHEEVRKGKFREDLLNRLERLDIHVPSLNQRREDIPLLIEHFMQKFYKEYDQVPHKYLTIEALNVLKQMNWTGNVRQLRNIVARLIIYTKDRVEITAQDIAEHIIQRHELHPYAELFGQFQNRSDMVNYMSTEFEKFRKDYAMV